jgi:hypothetical protein
MSRKLGIGLAVLLLVVVGIVVGVLALPRAGPSGPARKLVGTWAIQTSQEIQKAVEGELAKKDPQAASALGEKFRSNERVYFAGNGECRHVQELLGMSLITEGTWQAAEAEGNKLVVKFHKKKLTVLDPKGGVKEEAHDSVVEWTVSEVDADQWLATMTTDDGKSQRFGLRRAGD